MEDSNRESYLELLKMMLTDAHRKEAGQYSPIVKNRDTMKLRFALMIDSFFRRFDVALSRPINYKKEDILNGGPVWAPYAESMLGTLRMDNIQYCLEQIKKDKIEGDVIETGIWRGGASIFMRGFLKAHQMTDKKVWAADSFDGIPKPNPEKYAADKGDRHYTAERLKVSLEEVQNNFSKYDLLDEKVIFLKGWFKDTLPTIPKETKFSLLRLDGDIYESTIDALNNLYPKLTPGGFVIIDDYGSVPACKSATDDYRETHHITEKMERIDRSGFYWRKNN